MVGRNLLGIVGRADCDGATGCVKLQRKVKCIAIGEMKVEQRGHRHAPGKQRFGSRQSRCYFHGEAALDQRIFDGHGNQHAVLDHEYQRWLRIDLHGKLPLVPTRHWPR